MITKHINEIAYMKIAGNLNLNYECSSLLEYLLALLWLDSCFSKNVFDNDIIAVISSTTQLANPGESGAIVTTIYE